jgi:Zn-dependent protease with chaperone function
MGELARESTLHALVATFVLAALIRSWRVDDPTMRVRLGLLAVAGPAVGGPLLHLLAPARTSDAFRQATALFDSARWNDVRVLGAGLADVVVAASAVLGLLLLVRDLVPWLQDRFATPVAQGRADAARARTMFDRLLRRMGVTAPPLVVLEEEAMVLQCAGVRRPSVFVSRAACEALDDEELEAALAHEIAHLERRDPALGWVLMGARVLLWFNPVVQVLARGVTHELERRADERAAAVTGRRVALAAALLKVFRATDGAYRAPRWPVPGLDAGGRAVTRFRTAALEVRCRRLLDPAIERTAPRGLADAQVLLAGAGMMALLFFVV